jgi:hypothetical protein
VSLLARERLPQPMGEKSVTRPAAVGRRWSLASAQLSAALCVSCLFQCNRPRP